MIDIQFKYTSKNESRKYLVVDIGGTNTRVCLVKGSYEIVEKVRFPTPKEPDFFRESVRNIYENWVKTETLVERIGVSVAGAYFPLRGTIWLPNAFGAREFNPNDLFDFRGDLVVTDDRKAGALGEMVLGKARGVENFLYLVVGTGIGLGIVVGGVLLEGFQGLAGSIGWNRGDGGTLESRLAGPGIRERYGVLGEVGREPDEIFTRVHDDPVAYRVVKETASILGSTLAALINTLNPELIVLSGSVTQGWPVMSKVTLEEISKGVSPMIALPKIVLSELGEDGQIIGVTSLIIE